MIIERLDLRAFGSFTDFSLDLSASPNRFHIICGPNESGKSTSLRAITSLLYGMPSKSVDSYLHPTAKVRVGGRLVDADGNVLECVRKRGKKETLRNADDSEPIDEMLMQQMLRGVDQKTFEQRFGLSHDELVQGGAEIISGGGDLGSILFAAGAGVSRLREVQADLQKRCREIYIPRGTKGSTNQILRELNEKKNLLRQAQIPPADFQLHKSRLDQQRDLVARLEREIKATASELLRFQSLQKSLPLIPKWKSTNTALRSLESVPLLDNAFAERRRNAETNREVAARKIADLTQQLANLKETHQSLEIDSKLMEREGQVEQLYKKLGAREDADRKRVQLQRELAELDRQMLVVLKEWQIDVEITDGVSHSDAIEQAVVKYRVSDAVRTRVNELSRKHEGVMQRRDDAAEEVESIKQKISDIQEQLDQSEAGGDPDALNQLLDSISHPDAFLNSLNDHQTDVDRAKRNCDTIHRRLVGTDATYAQVAKFRLPSDSTLSELTQRMHETAAAVAAAKSKHEEFVGQRNDINRRIRAEEKGQPLPTLTALQQARDERNALLEKLNAQTSPSEKDIADLRAATTKADQIVDTIRQHDDQVRRRSMDLAELEGLNEEIEANESLIEQRVEAAESAQMQWQAVWQKIGVVADSPVRMQLWVTDHEQLVLAVDALGEEKKRLNDLQQRIQSTCSRLRTAVEASALVGAGPESESFGNATLFAQEDSQIDLVRLYDEALTVRRRLADDRARRNELESRLLELKQRLPESKTRLQTKQKQADAWQSDWETATSSFSQNTDGTPTVVGEMLAQVSRLVNQKSKRDELERHIRSIAEDDEAFQKEIAELVSALEREFVDDGANEIVRMLFVELQSTREVITKRSLIQQQIADVQQQLTEMSERQTECDVIVQQLCAEADCSDFAALLDVERKSQQKSDLESTRSALEDQLGLLAGKVELHEFVETAMQQDVATLEIDVEQLQSKLEQAKEQLNQAQQEVGALQNEFDKIDGSSEAADLSQNIQFLAGDLTRDTEEYVRLKIASMILQRSIEHYRNENQGPVLQYARKVFAQLTCGQYESLRVDYDAKGQLVLLGVRAGKTSIDVPAPAMSTGTADSLYLALRLASLRHQLSQGTRIPLIVDDCLVQLDDQRTVAALNALSELANETQVILFTHHRHVVELANKNLRSDEFHTHDLVC